MIGRYAGAALLVYALSRQIRSGLGQTRQHHVLTWLGSEKALAIAAHADGHGYGTPDGIYDIDVEELGPAARDERGAVISEGYLSDRMEF